MEKQNSSYNHDREKDVENLINIIRDVEEIALPDISVSWEKVLLRSRRKGNTSKIVLYCTSFAAVILVLTGIFVTLRMQSERSGNLLSVNLLEEISADISSHEEVILVDKEEIIKLDDEVSLVYEEDGNVYVAEETSSGKILDKSKTGENPGKINQIIVPKGKKANVTFSDGTKLYVNSGSRVIYPQMFARKKREIIVEGEVFIDVAKDEKRPFIVKTSAMEIVVLGTQFNVSAYKEATSSSVVLVKGSVGVKTDITSDYEVIQPNQLIEYNGMCTQITDVNVYEYISWIDNMMLLNQSTLGQVLDRLSYSYGRTIHCSPEIRDIPISGKLDLKEDLLESIRIICLSLSLEYQEDELNNIVLTLK